MFSRNEDAVAEGSGIRITEWGKAARSEGKAVEKKQRSVSEEEHPRLNKER